MHKRPHWAANLSSAQGRNPGLRLLVVTVPSVKSTIRLRALLGIRPSSILSFLSVGPDLFAFQSHKECPFTYFCMKPFNHEKQFRLCPQTSLFQVNPSAPSTMLQVRQCSGPPASSVASSGFSVFKMGFHKLHPELQMWSKQSRLHRECSYTCGHARTQVQTLCFHSRGLGWVRFLGSLVSLLIQIDQLQQLPCCLSLTSCQCNTKDKVLSW